VLQEFTAVFWPVGLATNEFTKYSGTPTTVERGGSTRFHSHRNGDVDAFGSPERTTTVTYRP
jgi:hypothetical protein